MIERVDTSAGLHERIRNVLRRIETAAERSDRDSKDISLIAIGKTHPKSILQAAIEAGITDLGENRIQEAEEKIVALGRHAARWHLVGHLQTNKAKRAVSLFDFIHSLDSISLARRLDRFCLEENRMALPVLIQVSLAGEDTKSGVPESDLPELAAAVNDCPRLRLSGLMTLPPFFEEPEDVRPFFRKLRGLRDQMDADGSFGNKRGELSMGMSHDFEVAIEEGATMVRVGTAIFGERVTGDQKQ